MAYDGPERRRFTECPNPECRQSMNNFIQKINNSLFGPDEQSGLMKRIRKIEHCVGKKVSRGAMIGTAITVVGILVVIFVPMVTGAIRTLDKINERSIKVETTAAHNEKAIADLESFDRQIEGEHKSIIEEMNRMIGESERRLKEHMDLVIRSHDHSSLRGYDQRTEKDKLVAQ